MTSNVHGAVVTETAEQLVRQYALAMKHTQLVRAEMQRAWDGTRKPRVHQQNAKMMAQDCAEAVSRRVKEFTAGSLCLLRSLPTDPSHP